ncbi:MAG: septum formation initiator [Sphingomonadales bacterium]|nr:septum formation initiator [Sphingomonadales bacterium]
MLKKSRSEPKLARESLVQGVALVCLLVLTGFSLAGPSGILAWAENQRLLAERRSEVVQLVKERDELRNRVALLDPRHMDPDLAGELLRSNLNVAHPDEMVMLLH